MPIYPPLRPGQQATSITITSNTPYVDPNDTVTIGYALNSPFQGQVGVLVTINGGVGGAPIESTPTYNNAAGAYTGTVQFPTGVWSFVGNSYTVVLTYQGNAYYGPSYATVGFTVV